jgi:cytidyltransferase-like protein
MIDKIVFFPGKFHPPHLGHARTILNLMSKYERVIVGVSEDIPDNPVTNPDIVLNILKDLFSLHNNVKIYRIFGVLTKKIDLLGLPEFDILVSGNPDVLNWAKKFNIETEFIPRSEGYLFSGTEIRDELQRS